MGRLVLHGSPRLLDEELVQETSKLEGALRGPQLVIRLLRNLLSTYLRLHPRFELESGQSYGVGGRGQIVADMAHS